MVKFTKTVFILDIYKSEYVYNACVLQTHYSSNHAGQYLCVLQCDTETTKIVICTTLCCVLFH